METQQTPCLLQPAHYLAHIFVLLFLQASHTLQLRRRKGSLRLLVFNCSVKLSVVECTRFLYGWLDARESSWIFNQFIVTIRVLTKVLLTLEVSWLSEQALGSQLATLVQASRAAVGSEDIPWRRRAEQSVWCAKLDHLDCSAITALLRMEPLHASPFYCCRLTVPGKE